MMRMPVIADIEAQFPQLAPVSARFLGEGCDSTALLVNDEWVFRFPKSAEVERQLTIEAALLPLIVDRVPLPVPRFRYFGRPGEHVQRAFVGYPKLAGRPCLGVDPADVPKREVEQIGVFLAALHACPVDAARACGVPVEDLAASIEEIRDDALGSLQDVAQIAPDAPHERWRRYLETTPSAPDAARLALAHNDFAAEHILWNAEGGALTGVIDWSDAAIVHPCVDFAGLFHWGGGATAAVVWRAYCAAGGHLNEADLVIAQYLGACRGAMDVTFGLETQRPEYVAAGIRALRLCCAEGLR